MSVQETAAAEAPASAMQQSPEVPQGDTLNPSREHWTDDQLREHLEAARQRVNAVYEEAKNPPVTVVETLPKFLQDSALKAAVPTSEPMQVRDGWEPPCVSCGVLLGYTTRADYYVPGRTLCPRCSSDNLEARLTASGISYIEIDKPLDALVSPANDPLCRDLDPKDLQERETEFRRYMAFLRRFASLKPAERMKPPFAFVYGNLGTGKSGGAERAMRDAIRNGCAGRSVRFSDLVRKIYDTYQSHAGAGRGDTGHRDSNTSDLIKTYSSIHLLLIHEVGPDADTDHALGLFFDFVDERHQACLPTIFTSNYAPDADSLGARMGGRASDDTRVRGILDRISGGVRENVFCLIGPSWRGRSAA